MPDGLYEYRAHYSPGIDIRPPAVGHLSRDGAVIPERVGRRHSTVESGVLPGANEDAAEAEDEERGGDGPDGSFDDCMSEGSFNHSVATECFSASDLPYTDDSLLD